MQSVLIKSWKKEVLLIFRQNHPAHLSNSPHTHVTIIPVFSDLNLYSQISRMHRTFPDRSELCCSDKALSSINPRAADTVELLDVRLVFQFEQGERREERGRGSVCVCGLSLGSNRL